MIFFGKKIGMTHIEDGFLISPATVIDVTSNVIAKVSDKKTLVGFGKIKNPTKAQLGQYKELGYAPKVVLEIDTTEGLVVGPIALAETPTIVCSTRNFKR